MPRRIATYASNPEWFGLNFTATLGAFVFGPAVLFTVINLVRSYRKNVPSGPNPWDATEMEWTGNYSETGLAVQTVPPSNAAVLVAESPGTPENPPTSEEEKM